jgi:RNA polymerase sigma-B factor
MASPVVSRDATPDADVSLLFTRFRRDHNAEDLEVLVLRFLPLAQHLARRYSTGAEREDLEQIASLALVNAIHRFDPGRGTAFTSFAFPTIIGELKRYFRDCGWSVRVPRSLQELAARVEQTIAPMTAELGRTPTAEEIARRLETTVELVLEARASASAHRADSLDRRLGEGDDAGTLVERLGGEDPGYREVEDNVDVDRLLATLPAKEREALRLRFREDLVQREIGERLGISQMHVSRLIGQAIERLQETHE